jgi:hypothetical protein
MLKKSFRVLLSRDPEYRDAPDRYLLIKKTDEEGAFATGFNNKDRFLPRSFILNNWGGNITLIFPYDRNFVNLRKGMDGPEILQLQRNLQRLGYLVHTTGNYDSTTSDQVKRFQKDFGLEQDGIAGLKTRALLFGMTE